MAITTRFALRAMLGLQIGLAVGLLSQDFQKVIPQLPMFQPVAPALDQPIAPGDQTRRFAPARLPFLPGRRNPGIDTSGQPSRLFLEVLEDGRLRMSGSIAEGDAGRFDEWLAEQAAQDVPLPEQVVLHSSGGSVGQALAIGRALRMAGMNSGVASGDFCLSACPYMLMGGVERVVSRDAKVGVHQHYYGETSYLPAFLAVEDIQRSQAGVLLYLDEMGVDPLMMAAAMATPPQDIYVMVAEELTDWAVATEVVE